MKLYRNYIALSCKTIENFESIELKIGIAHLEAYKTQ